MSFSTLKRLSALAVCCAVACSCQAQNPTSSDQDIPPAVAKQLEDMRSVLT